MLSSPFSLLQYAHPLLALLLLRRCGPENKQTVNSVFGDDEYIALPRSRSTSSSSTPTSTTQHTQYLFRAHFFPSYSLRLWEFITYLLPLALLDEQAPIDDSDTFVREQCKRRRSGETYLLQRSVEEIQ